ncbi:MAG: ORF6N domain-containing protein, partial [Acidobacteriota bacterium]|nr:ORF6N domain-containing protein [Acidobacteriota bacterium]
MSESIATVPGERIEQRSFLIRGERVMLDFDLATLYQVTTKALNQAVRRNRERFPEDFMF